MNDALRAFDDQQLARLELERAWSRRAEVSVGEGDIVCVHALDAAPPGGPAPLTVVCVHGNPTWSLLWRSFHRRLGDRYRVIAIDQVSMGFSERAAPRGLAQRIDDLGRILAAFEVEGPVVLAAHDWGGPVGLGWALGHPERVVGILLANTGVAIPAGGVPLPIRLLRREPLRSLACERTPLFIRATLAAGGGRVSADVRDAYLRPYRSRSDRRAIADFVADIPTSAAHPSQATLTQIGESLPGLEIPVLLAWGERDPVFHPGFAADLRRRLPQAELQRFPSAGHLVVEQEDVAALADSWIGGLRARRGAARAAPQSAAEAPRAGLEDRLWSALAAREQDDAVALVAAGRTLSFRDLAQEVATLAQALRAKGVLPGERVALLTPEPPDLIAAAYACWVAGAVTVVVDRGLGLRGIARALRGAQPRWLLGTRRTLGAARVLRWAPAAGSLELGSLRANAPALSVLAARIAPGAESAAAVVFTSGATGSPKGVLYDQRRMAAQFAAVRDCYAIGEDDRLVAAFAPFALYGPAFGIPVAVPQCDITRPSTLRATALADACTAIGATIVFAAPAALAGVLASADDLSGEGREALRRLRLVLSAGAPVPQVTLSAFGRLASAARLHTPYGMTEALALTDIDLETLLGIGPGRGVCVGKAVRGAEVRIDPLPETDGQTGEIVVSAPWISLGYDGLWTMDEKGRTSDGTGREWHRSGDVGHLDTEQRLWVEGRLAHVLQTSEGPLTPVPLEVVATEATGMRTAAVGVGPPGCAQLVIVLERPGKTRLAPASLDATVRAALAPTPLAAVLSVPQLPVDSRHNSKIDRARLSRFAEAFLEGTRPPRRI